MCVLSLLMADSAGACSAFSEKAAEFCATLHEKIAKGMHHELMDGYEVREKLKRTPTNERTRVRTEGAIPELEVNCHGSPYGDKCSRTSNWKRGKGHYQLKPWPSERRRMGRYFSK